MMRNLAIRAQEGEQMDSPDLPEPVYREVLGGLRRINAATLANRPTLDFLSRAARRDRPFRLLDVGFGDRGMIRSSYSWSRRNGMQSAFNGIAISQSSDAVAKALHPE